MTVLDIVSEFTAREGQTDVNKANWYTVAATALAAANAGKDVPGLYRFATQGLGLEQQKLVQRRFKEAILKGSVLYGVPRSLQALLPLFATLKDEEIDHYGPRTQALNDPDIAQKRKARATKYFDTIWTPEAAQKNRDSNFKFQPDLSLLNTQTIYELWISEDGILSDIETQMINIAALICSNSPVQAMWHTKGLIRHGGTKEQAKFAQELALAVVKHYDLKIGPVTKVDDIDFEDATPH